MVVLALTDHDALYGVVPFVQAAAARGIHPILGAELTMAGGAHLTLLVEDAAGWRSLCQLISHAQAHTPKGQAALPWATLDAHTDGLICLTGCRQGPVAAAVQRLDMAGAERAARWLCARFGPTHTCIEVQHHLHPATHRSRAGSWTWRSTYASRRSRPTTSTTSGASSSPSTMCSPPSGTARRSRAPGRACAPTRSTTSRPAGGCARCSRTTRRC